MFTRYREDDMSKSIQASPRTSRLRQARLAAGLSMDDAVAQLNNVGLTVSKAALSNYELGKRAPNAQTVIRLAAVLGVKPGFLLSEQRCELTWAAFRCKSNLTKTQENGIKARATIAGEQFIYLREALFPNDVPEFPRRVKVSDPDQAEPHAEALRRTWGLGTAPIESVVESVEAHGAFSFAYHGLGDTAFDGLSGWINDSVPMTVFNAEVPTDRKRFDVSHELGHLLLDTSHLGGKDEEKIAHRFAAAFLVPAKLARKELGARRRSISFAELAMLKRKYGLSMAAWMRRAVDLEIISPSVYKHMCIDFSRRGWRKQEPVDYAGDEEPLLLKQMTLRAMAEGAITPDEADEIIPGISDESELLEQKDSSLLRSAMKVLSLPKTQRDKVLATAAVVLGDAYEKDDRLTEFDAYGEDDIHA